VLYSLSLHDALPIFSSHQLKRITLVASQKAFDTHLQLLKIKNLPPFSFLNIDPLTKQTSHSDTLQALLSTLPLLQAHDILITLRSEETRLNSSHVKT